MHMLRQWLTSLGVTNAAQATGLYRWLTLRAWYAEGTVLEEPEPRMVAMWSLVTWKAPPIPHGWAGFVPPGMLMTCSQPYKGGFKLAMVIHMVDEDDL